MSEVDFLFDQDGTRQLTGECDRCGHLTVCSLVCFRCRAHGTVSNADSSKVPSAAEIMRNMEEALKLMNAPCYICGVVTQTPRGTGKLAICAKCRKQWHLVEAFDVRVSLGGVELHGIREIAYGLPPPANINIRVEP